MREEEELVDSLCGATLLVDNAARGRISVEELVKRYDNFYYYEALDGHEADDETKELLGKYRGLISLHEEVQTNVVDIIYLGPKEMEDEFVAAGRITPDVAARRLAEIAKKYELTLWLKKLQRWSSERGR